VKGRHVLIYVVVLRSQKFGGPIGRVLRFFLGAVLAGIGDGALGLGCPNIPWTAPAAITAKTIRIAGYNFLKSGITGSTLNTRLAIRGHPRKGHPFRIGGRLSVQWLRLTG
jgi:hypothetical protein